ncbi:hypothetical protein NDU88_004443 [Pleurodeles waltl]|uniref:Uncharacterized protein n=1 Tax=Pleurodeles waltl TaxID=8319 RepID=A0AAV7M7J5_PLEWA|nr:hypothetical protein NDU88_004443 [Pleurodeles waltl]
MHSPLATEKSPHSQTGTLQPDFLSEDLMQRLPCNRKFYAPPYRINAQPNRNTHPSLRVENQCSACCATGYSTHRPTRSMQRL